MGRAFNAIELKLYHARTAKSAATAARVVEDDRTLAADFPDSDDDLIADPDPLVSANPALPQWHQVMRDSSVLRDEPSTEDAAPVPANAPPSGSSDPLADQRVMAGDREELRNQLEDIWREKFPEEYQRMT